MNVLQVLTYLSPTGDFGGPVRVAANQAAELRRRGHRVHLVAGARGYARLPQRWEGTPVTVGTVRQLVPGAGVSGLASPALLARARRRIEWADVVHVNLGRDLVTMPVAALARMMGKPLVLQTHGMIDPSDRLLSRPLDAVLTRRLLSAAGATLYLTEAERIDLEAVVGRPLARALRLPNGIGDTPPVADFRDDKLVLFAARVHDQKRPEIFVQLAAEVIRAVPDARFLMIGPDGGKLAAVRSRIAEHGLDGRIAYLGALDHAALLGWFGRVAVYVLPSVYEPFGMTVLEAMATRTPVVVTETCGLAPDVARSGAGAVTAPDPAALARGVVQLLQDPTRRAAAGDAGAQLAMAQFSIGAIVDCLETVYEAVRRPGASGPPLDGARSAAPPATQRRPSLFASGSESCRE